MEPEVNLGKIIVEELKAEGLDIAEDVAMKVIEVGFKVLEKVVVASPNKFDDLALPLLPIIKPMLVKLADKIHKDEVVAV